VGEKVWANTVASVREHAKGEKHRTEDTEVTEGDGVGGRKKAWVDTVASVREHAKGKKHRTEDTEVTEGDWGWWAESLGEHRFRSPQRSRDFDF
jgi:hypothetical protein